MYENGGKFQRMATQGAQTGESYPRESVVLAERVDSGRKQSVTTVCSSKAGIPNVPRAE